MLFRSLAVYREDGVNTVALSKKIRKILDDLKDRMPGSVKVDVMYDRSAQIGRASCRERV